MARSLYQQGFTAVELLITLFVAVAFLTAGYQLYSVVIKDGGDTRAESTASNVAYDYVRQYSTLATNPCVSSQPLSGSSITVPALASPVISVSISCPQDDAPAISKIETIITYGAAELKTVKYSTLVDASKIAAPAGNLIGWWQFNGNASDSSGSGLTTGVVTAATLTIGQNGASNNAYAFNGTSAYITIPTSPPIARPTTAITASAWIKTANVQSSNSQEILSNIQTGGFALALDDAVCLNQFAFMLYIGGTYRSACATVNTSLNNTWMFLTGVYNGTNIKLYVNGALVASTGVSGTFTQSAASVPICIGAQPSATGCTSGQYFSGSIDDARIYSRALTPTEIQLLFTQGAQ